jgi:hypothetical protein
VAQAANLSELAGCGLIKPPAAVVLETVIMATGMAKVALVGGPALGMVLSVVGVGAAGGAPAADHDAAAIPDLEVAA